MTHPVLRCPSCHATLTSGNDALRCDGCDRIYPVQDGIADFSGGRYYDNFDPSTRLTPEAQQGLALEFEGAKRRIIDYYEPALRKHGAVRVLDCGTGNGVAVDVLNERGFEGWGADLSALRKYQWRERVRR
ncbi:MAG TPA: Trm112 family protein, partial [Thermoanaerobaculia bacterium]